MLLALVEEATDEAQRVFLRRRHPQLMTHLAILILAVDPLRRIDRVTGHRRDVGFEVGDVGGVPVVEQRVVAVVGHRVIVAAQVAAGVGDVEVADMALDRERRLPPLVGNGVGVEALCGQNPLDARIPEGGAVLPGALPNESGRHGPPVAEIDPECRSSAVSLGRVEALLRLHG